MAKVLVVSDNHGRIETLSGIIAKEKPFDLMIHCGDNELPGGITQLTEMADTPVYAVAGNCDYFSNLKAMEDFDFKGHHILVVHGYYEGVRAGSETREDNLYLKAEAVGADIVFFGHTHRPFYREADGVIYANPGSTDKPRQDGGAQTYIVMEITDGEKPIVEEKWYSK